MNIGDWINDKNVPVCEVSVPACSYTEVIPEYINPVTEELGEQTVTYNVNAHDGLYYFSTKEKYNTFVNTIIPGLSAQVEEPTGIRVKLDLPELEEIPSVYIINAKLILWWKKEQMYIGLLYLIFQYLHQYIVTQRNILY